MRGHTLRGEPRALKRGMPPGLPRAMTGIEEPWSLPVTRLFKSKALSSTCRASEAISSPSSPSCAEADSAVMSYEDVAVPRICEEIDAALSDGVFQSAKAVATVESIHRQAANLGARGDVVTQLTRPRNRGPSHNEWVHGHADVMMLRMMQIILDETHAAERDPPNVFKDWLVVSRQDPSRRHLVFKLYVNRRLKRDRSVLRRVLYHSVLYYLFHSEEDEVDIRLRFPAAEEPQASEANGHHFFSYTKKRLVGPSARVTDTDDEDVPGRADGSHVQIMHECLFRTANDVLKYYLRTMQDVDSGAVFFLAKLLRELVTDTSFDWHALTSPDHQGLFTSGPRAYRLLLPRQSTREKIDNLMFTEG